MLYQPEPSGGLVNSTSIIICTVDRPGDLEDCLKSLEPFRGVGVEVIVVNNGPRGALVEQIAHRYAARVVIEPKRGVSRARNTGIRAAQGSILAFLDDDSVADSNWLPLLIAPFQDSGVLAVSGSIHSQTLADPVSETFDYLHRAQFPESRLIVDGNAERHTFPMRTALVGNANMAIRREAFERFGYFDTRMGRGTRIGSGEEPDLLLRILLGAGKIAAEPAARILHRHSTDWRAIRRWAFQSGCAHTAILTKHFLQEPSRRGQILQYAASRLRLPPAPEARTAKRLNFPQIPLLLGSLFGPLAFLLAGEEKPRVGPS